MHITAVCPRCRTRYQLNPELRGKKMRCTDPTCREVFEIQDADTAFDRSQVIIASGKISKTGSVSDLVPLLPAEEATGQAPPPPSPEAPAPAGRPRQPNHVADDPLARVPRPLVPAEPAAPAPPTETGPKDGSWREPPPVRGKEGPPASPTPPPRKAPRRPNPPASTPDLPAVPQDADWRTASPPAAAPGVPRSRAPAPPPASAPNGADRRADAAPLPARENLPSGPVELEAGQWDAPPVRQRGPEASDSFTGPLAPPGEMLPPIEAEFAETEHPPAAKTRRAKRLMLLIVTSVVVVLGIAGGIAWYILSQGEQRQYAKAWDDYQEERFRDGGERLRKLVDKFPDSTRRDEYAFLADLADLRAALADTQSDTRSALERVGRFLDDHPDTSDQQKKFLPEHGAGLGTSLVKRSETFLDQNALNDGRDLGALLDLIERQLKAVRQRIPDAISEGDANRIAGRIVQSRARIAQAEEKRKNLALAKEVGKKGTPAAIKNAEDILKAKGLANDPEGKKIIDDLHAAHRQRVRYVKAADRAPPGPEPGRGDDLESAILLDPLVQGRPRESADDGQVVLALSRGVLYALSAATGRTKWALRVGIDTSHLPLRLPATAAHQERLLVLSADTRTLRALDLDGRQLWSYRLSASALGRPVLLQRRGALIAYVPTHDGNVHEIELAQGTLRGHFELGQPLTVGGVHRKGTNLVYFPADDSCIYVLDIEKKECVTVLYTHHPGGTLRGEPLIVGDSEVVVAGAPAPPAYLLLSQADGLDRTVLRLFQLPAGGAGHPRERVAEQVAMKAPPRIRGWTWFTPYHDGEKVVCLSDAGRLGLFGLRQPRNDDSPLFPLVPPPAGEEHTGIDLIELFGTRESGVSRGRAMVAHVQGEEFWVLAHTRLQRLALGLNRKEGPRADPLWESPLQLGSPLHEPQVFDGRTGQSLYLVTEPLKRPVHLVTAVDPEGMPDSTAEHDPRILWQRQLGMVCQGEPLVLGNEVLAVDQGGGMFRFDLRQFKRQAEGQWQVGGQIVAGGLDQNAAFTPRLLRGGEDVVYQLAVPGDGKELVLRRYQAAKKGGRPEVREERLPLSGATLAGEPILIGETLLISTSDNRLERYTLPKLNSDEKKSGPSWRARHASPGARCYLAALGPDGFLSTDGSRGLTHWNWPWDKNKIYQPVLPPEKKSADPPTVELPDRIVAAPLVLPRKQDGLLRVLVADARGVLTLLQGEFLAPVPAQTWDLGGTVTAGPFLRGGYVGCVVDHDRLVWIDPDKQEKLWQYKAPGGAIVGQPALVEDLVVVCDEAGHFIGLDPATGLRQGPGYTLKAAVAPAATPVAFGPGRAFAPLTDGTVLMLSLDHLRVPWWLWPLYAQ